MDNKPEKKFRAGAVTATIWRNASEKGSYGTVQLERSYLDKDSKWKSAGSLRLNDIPKAELVLQKAYEYLAVKQEEQTV
ncbi:hypothetical protein JXB11_01200 [Candidatus Woesearchaeota archaeon]|nr:hypothetical protein [Candidatus Woesearchaeota archaeon]